jgi:hypothetical protein
MAKLLLGDQAFEVELLTDVPTNWPGIKVMSKGPSWTFQRELW